MKMTLEEILLVEINIILKLYCLLPFFKKRKYTNMGVMRHIKMPINNYNILFTMCTLFKGHTKVIAFVTPLVQ